MQLDGHFDTKTSLLGGLVAENCSVDHADDRWMDSIWTYRATEWLIIANPGQLSTLNAGIGEAAMPGKN